MAHAHPGPDLIDAFWRHSAVATLEVEIISASEPGQTELRLLADNLPSLCWIANGDGYIVWYNRRWHEYCGTRPADMEGWGWQSVHDPDILPAVLKGWSASIASGEAFEMTFPIRGADGIYRPFLTRVTPLKNAEGQVMRWIGNNTDVSAQHKVEAARLKSEAQLRALNADLERQVVERSSERGTTWQLSPHLLSVIDLVSACFVRVNPAWAKTLGWQEREMNGMPFAPFVHPDDLPALAPAWDQVCAGSPVLNFENRYRAKDGSYHWLSWLCVPENGKLYSSARDITGEKEQAALVDLRTLERDRLWNASEDLLVAADYDGKLLRCSPSWTRLFGFSEAELLAGTYYEIIHPEDLPAVMAALAEMRVTGKPARFEDRVRRRDASWRSISWTLSPDPGGRELTGVGRDITNQREIEDRLRQAQKMEAVGQMTGGLAHDFNNVLMGVAGSLELLQMRLSQGRLNEISHCLAMAQEACARGAGLTQRLLAFSRQQTLDPKPTHINDLIAGMEDMIRRTVGPSIRTTVIADPQLWGALVDANQLDNALLNLCINARDAMPSGGLLTIETANRWLDEPAASVCDLAPGAYLTIRVTDTGTGMTPEIVSRALDPFFTTKPTGIGTGLGLSMVYGFALQSNGHLTIESELGRGTTMSLYLPRVNLSEAPRTQAAPPVTDDVQAGLAQTLLLVDDDLTIRSLIAEVLNDYGYRTIDAGNAVAALEILETPVKIDLLITDVGLQGGLNGKELAESGRRLRPRLPVLFITGLPEENVSGGASLSPQTQVLTKPFRIDQLFSRIRSMLGAE